MKNKLRNKFYYKFEDLYTFIQSITPEIRIKGYKLIYGIPRGGLIPAIMLSHSTGIPVIVSQAFPPVPDKTKILVVDDIFDTGETINRCLKDCSVFTSNVNVMCPIVRVNVTNDYEDVVSYFDKELYDDRYVVFPWEVE